LRPARAFRKGGTAHEPVILPTLALLAVAVEPVDIESGTATSSESSAVTSTQSDETAPLKEEREIAELPQDDEPLFGIKIHGFVSQGFIKSTANNYLGNSE